MSSRRHDSIGRAINGEAEQMVWHHLIAMILSGHNDTSVQSQPER